LQSFFAKPSWHSAHELRNRYDETILSNTDPKMHKKIFEVVLDTEELTGIVVTDEQLVVSAMAKAMLKIPVRIPPALEHTKLFNVRKMLTSWFLNEPAREPDHNTSALRKERLLDQLVINYSDAVKLSKPQEMDPLDLLKQRHWRRRLVNHAAGMVIAAQNPNLVVKNWTAGTESPAEMSQPQAAVGRQQTFEDTPE
jgi:hypothetical protein